MNQCISKRHQAMLDTVTSIGDLTNVRDPKYKKELKCAQDAGRHLMNFDYRRNQVTLDSLVQRTVVHCLVPENMKDWETTELAVKLLNDVLHETKDLQELERLQLIYMQSGAVQLVVDILMQKPDNSVSIIHCRGPILI